MKRWLIVFAALVLLLAACQSAPVEHVDEFREAYIASVRAAYISSALEHSGWQIALVGDVEVSRTGISFSLQNRTDLEFNYGAAWELAYYSGGDWLPVPHLPQEIEWAWSGIGFSLQSGEVQEYHPSFEWLMGELANGRYMLIKDGWLGEWPGGERVYVLVEFFVSAETRRIWRR